MANLDAQRAGARVQSVFKEFLDDRCGTLDNLASGDFADEFGWQDADGHCVTIPYRKEGGGGEGIRTPDLYSAIVALSQLSYAPALHRGAVYQRLTHAASALQKWAPGFTGAGTASRGTGCVGTRAAVSYTDTQRALQPGQ